MLSPKFESITYITVCCCLFRSWTQTLDLNLGQRSNTSSTAGTQCNFLRNGQTGPRQLSAPAGNKLAFTCRPLCNSTDTKPAGLPLTKWSQTRQINTQGRHDSELLLCAGVKVNPLIYTQYEMDDL